MKLLRLKQLFRKEIIQVWRDPRLRLLVFLLPFLQILLYGYAINFDVEHVPTAVFDESRTAQSREFIRQFSATRYFSLDSYVKNEAEMQELLDRGAVTLVLRLPWDFARKLTAGKTAPVQLIVDGTDSNTALWSAGMPTASFPNTPWRFCNSVSTAWGCPRRRAP